MVECSIDADFTGTSDGSIDAPLTDLAQAITDTDEAVHLDQQKI